MALFAPFIFLKIQGWISFSNLTIVELLSESFYIPLSHTTATTEFSGKKSWRQKKNPLKPILIDFFKMLKNGRLISLSSSLILELLSESFYRPLSHATATTHFSEGNYQRPKKHPSKPILIDFFQNIENGQLSPYVAQLFGSI